MIEKTEVDGRKATVAYINDDCEPCDKDEATLAKVIFDDGDTLWLSMKKAEPESGKAEDRVFRRNRLNLHIHRSKQWPSLFRA